MRLSTSPHRASACGVLTRAAVDAGAAAIAAAVGSRTRRRTSTSQPAGRNPRPPVECAATMAENDSTGQLPTALPGQPLSEPRRVAPLIDIGINLAHDSYDSDREAVIARAEGAG